MVYNWGGYVLLKKLVTGVIWYYKMPEIVYNWDYTCGHNIINN